MLHLREYWLYRCCTTSSYVTSPRVLVYGVLHRSIYIPQGTGGIDCVLHRPMLHLKGTGSIYGVLYRPILHSPPEYWWCIRCNTSISFYVTSTRILGVYKVFYIVLCYIPEDTGGM